MCISYLICVKLQIMPLKIKSTSATSPKVINLEDLEKKKKKIPNVWMTVVGTECDNKVWWAVESFRLEFAVTPDGDKGWD